MKLTSRVRALERIVSPPDRCEGCGFDIGAPVKMRITFAKPPDDGPDECPKCGRPLLQRISIRVVYGKDDEGTEVAIP